jgi:hypothetical protein
MGIQALRQLFIAGKPELEKFAGSRNDPAQPWYKL